MYVYRDNRPPRFRRVRAPDKSELETLVQLISQRVGRCLERQGLLEQDAKANGFSLHAGVSYEGHERKKVRAGAAREAALLMLRPADIAGAL